MWYSAFCYYYYCWWKGRWFTPVIPSTHPLIYIYYNIRQHNWILLLPLLCLPQARFECWFFHVSITLQLRIYVLINSKCIWALFVCFVVIAILRSCFRTFIAQDIYIYFNFISFIFFFIKNEKNVWFDLTKTESKKKFIFLPPPLIFFQWLMRFLSFLKKTETSK